MTQLQNLLDRLVKLLEGADIPFMVAGSFASTAHGLPRTTQDIDVIIDPATTASLESLVQAMSPNDYYVDINMARDALRRRSMFNVIDQASGWKIDFILRKNRPFSRDEFARRMQFSLLEVSVYIATPEDTIVAKLEWSKQSGGSERQRRDVMGILATLGSQLDRPYLERWIKELNVMDEWEEALRITV